MKRIDKWLCLHSKKYKLWRISKALGMKPYEWQLDFILGKTNSFGRNGGRGCGKTMAVIFRLLLLKPDADDAFMRYTLGLDPDFVTSIARGSMWYKNEYQKLSTICDNAGIPVVMLPKDGYSIKFSAIDEVHKWG